MTKKKLIAIFICISAYFPAVNAQQNLGVISRIHKDSTECKFILKHAKVLHAILNAPTKISWVLCPLNTDPKTVKFDKASSKKIEPLKNRFYQLEEKYPDLNLIAELYLFDKTDSVAMNDPEVNGQLLYNTLFQFFVDNRAAEFSGILFRLPLAPKGQAFALKIENNFLNETITVLTDPREREKIPVPPSKINIKQKNVVFQYNIKGLSNYFCSYNLYKKEASEAVFTKQNEQPIAYMATKDVIDNDSRETVDRKVIQGKTYFYQLRGIDYFGEERGGTVIQKIYVPKEVNGNVEFDSIYVNGTERVFEGNFYRTEDNHPPYTKEVTLLRSDSLEGPYKTMDKIALKEYNQPFTFRLKNYKTGDRFYYKLMVISPDKDTAMSSPSYFFTLDQDPPDSPTNLKGKIDSTGIMTLTWDQPKDTDIAGYKVFKGNYKQDEFYEITKKLTLNSSIQDTLPLSTLANDIYYFVISVDKNFNNSKNSDTILIVKPDTIAPVPTLFSNYEVTEIGVNLTWINSNSTDLSKMELIRFHDNVEKVLLTWTANKQEFTDTTVRAGISYRYGIRTYDKVGNKAYCKELPITFEPGYRPAIKVFRATSLPEKKGILLEWKSAGTDVYSYTIYRTRGDGKPILLKTLYNPQKMEYLDTNVFVSNKYAYQITVMYKSGISSQLSDKIEVGY